MDLLKLGDFCSLLTVISQSPEQITIPSIDDGRFDVFHIKMAASSGLIENGNTGAAYIVL